MRNLIFRFCLAFFVATTTISVPHVEGFKGKLAILSFENLSENPDASEYVMPLVKDRLQRKGFDIIDEATVNRFVIKERIRTIAYIPSDRAIKMGKELGVEAIMLGSVNEFEVSENPQISLSARIIDTSNGSIAWAENISIAGEDFFGIFGIGVIKDIGSLTIKAVERLVDSIKISNKDAESTYRIAVLPFLNKGRKIGAGKIVAYMFMSELSKSRHFIPVEFGDVRKTVLDIRMFVKGEIDYEKVKAITELLNVDGIIIGSVEAYPVSITDSPLLEVEINTRLIDARKRKILWSDGFRMNSESEIYVFDWGKMRTAGKVANRVISKIVRGMEAARWQ